MVIIDKCANCKQFNQEAESKDDKVCLRCKVDLAKGHTQLTDRNVEISEDSSNGEGEDGKGKKGKKE